MALRIGFATVFHTLWDVSEPYKHYFGAERYDFEWRIDYQYIQNLAMEEDNAILKAIGFGATQLDVNEKLKGISSVSFYETGGRGTDRPYYMFPPNIHKHGLGDIRKAGSLEYAGTHVINQDSVKALWTMYLKKEIVFPSCAENDPTNMIRPEWKRPIVLARRRLLELGILVHHDGEIMAQSYVERYDEKKAKDELKKDLISGHWGEDGERVELKLRYVDSFGFESQWGETKIVTYRDENNHIYKYMGSSTPAIGDVAEKLRSECETDHEFNRYDNWSNENREVEFTVMATLSHDEYNGVKETKIKRAKITAPLFKQ